MNLFKSAPTIETNRLFIRVVSSEDYKDYYRFCSNKNVCRYLTFNPYTNIFQAKKAINNMIRAYLSNSDINFSIIFKPENRIIGSISLSLLNDNIGEIGYILDEPYWNKKIMDEALKAIINVCDKYYNLDILIASYISDNIASEKLLLRNNFIFYEDIQCGLIKNNQCFNLKKVVLHLK